MSFLFFVLQLHFPREQFDAFVPSGDPIDVIRIRRCVTVAAAPQTNRGLGTKGVHGVETDDLVGSHGRTALGAFYSVVRLYR